MIQFEKPINLNGAELLNELRAENIEVANFPQIDGEGLFWLDIKIEDKNKTEFIVANHNGTTIAVDNSIAKAALLERLGITADEAALLLS